MQAATGDLLEGKASESASSRGNGRPTDPNQTEAPTPWEFDRASHKHVLICDEPETVIYRTRSHRIVVRQANWPDDDVWIDIARADVPALIEALRAVG